jgi:hypothetical protein
MSVTLNRYFGAIAQIAVTVLTAFTVLPNDAFIDSAATWASVIGLATLAVQAVVTYLVPLADARWAGWIKTVSALVLAGLGAAAQFLLQGTLTPVNFALVGVAVLNALLAEIGVQVRIDDPTLTKPGEVKAQKIALPVVAPAPAVSGTSVAPLLDAGAQGNPPTA